LVGFARALINAGDRSADSRFRCEFSATSNAVRDRCSDRQFRRLSPIFGDYRQFSAIIANVRRLSPILAIIANFRRKKMSPFFKKQLLGSLFCINRQRFESKAPIFFGENSFPGHNIGPWPASHVIIFYLHVCQSIDRPLWCPSLFSAASQKEQKREIPCES
jgi:hypothetical protein